MERFLVVIQKSLHRLLVATGYIVRNLNVTMIDETKQSITELLKVLLKPDLTYSMFDFKCH